MMTNGARCSENLPPCSVILETMADGLYTVDCTGTVRVWNPAMEQLTGYPSEEAVGKPCAFLQCESCAAGEPSAAEWERALVEGETDGVSRIECTILSRDGERIPIQKHARAIRDDAGEVLGVVETVTDLRPIKRLEAEVSTLQRQASHSTARCGRLIGHTRVMQEVFERIRLATASAATVLIHGETGSGKELVAEAIHTGGDRAEGPFVRVNCSALTETLLESELFGHVRGAFTGAVRDKVGRFEAADGGTIFLDELGDISPLIQLKLLRVLQDREFERVGDSRTRKVNVRVLAATHRNLREMVAEGKFREDLYYRIRVFDIAVPPLRERREDIPDLVGHFIGRFSEETGKSITGIDGQATYCFMDYCWPGNVRELENAIEHAFVTCQTDTIGVFDLPVELRMSELRNAVCRTRGRQIPGGAVVPTSPYSPDTPEGIGAALKAAGGNKSAAARLLGVDRTTVWRKMKQWDIPLQGG